MLRPLDSNMADRERDYDDTEGSLDPELLYTKEYCIGVSPAPCFGDERER